ncbi:MAG: ATP-binding protein [Lachnospiraceae bacterium]|nr:ATP-binding protein [Lachnospiraceae bacterium]
MEEEKKRISLREGFRALYNRFPVFRSLKVRIFLLTFFMGMIPCLILRYGILTNYEERVVNVRISEVTTQLRILANHLLLYDYLDNPTSEVVNAELTQFSSLYDGRVLIINDDVKIVKDTYDMSTGKVIVSGDVVACLQKGSKGVSSRYDRQNSYIEVIVPIEETSSLEDADYPGSQDAQKEVVNGVMLASVSTDSINATLEILARRSTLLLLILLVCIFSISLLASTILIRPFERLTKSISDVRAGFTSRPVEVNDYLETEHVIGAFNQVLGRMRALDESRQDFVSNVSHELKTPMTSMKVLADSLLQQEGDVPADVYKDFLQDIDSELDRENQMISELLTLAKMDRQQVTMNVKPVNINGLVEIVLKRVRPLAGLHDIEMTLVSEREVTAEVDEVKMTQVFTNLIENAVKYNREHGKVKVTIDSDHKNLIVTVEDTGIGIPAAEKYRIFERFYRVDKSRSREIGGTGLGLSITKSAILLHRGTINVESEEGKGSKFTVVIPLNYIPDSTSQASRA